jgi:regulator of protease activity HflC (stomatin/prohibitin superfamily)
MGDGAVTAVLVALVVLVGLLAALAAASVRVLREYERAVVFRLGRLVGQKGPGWSCSCRGSTAWCASRCAP